MNHPELDVSTIRNSFFYGYFFASDGVVTTDEIWGFAADDFKAIFLNVILPRLPSGKGIFSKLVTQPFSISILKTFSLSNQALSIKLFCALHIHDGVNTSAFDLARSDCSFFDFSTRDFIMLPLRLIIEKTLI